jgi:hypothetical protein
MVHSPLKIIAFNANHFRGQAYKARKQLQDLKIEVTLFSETHLKPHVRFNIRSYDIYQPDCEDGHKGGTAIAVKKGIPHACVDLPPLLSAAATGVCMLTGNTEIFLAPVYNLIFLAPVHKSPQTVE